MDRNKYEYLLVEAAQLVHEMTCPEPVCYHEILVRSCEVAEIETAFEVLLNYLGINAPRAEVQHMEHLPW